MGCLGFCVCIDLTWRITLGEEFPMLEQSTSTDNKHVADKYHGDFKLESQNASILWFHLRLVYNLKSEYAEPPLLRMQRGLILCGAKFGCLVATGRQLCP
jgi:hypothetical protein